MRDLLGRGVFGEDDLFAGVREDNGRVFGVIVVRRHGFVCL